MTTADEAVESFLEHYGVKGMKWGVRKDKSSSRSRKSFTTGVFAGVVAARFFGSRTVSVPVALVGETVAGVAGKRYADSFSEKKYGPEE